MPKDWIEIWIEKDSYEKRNFNIRMLKWTKKYYLESKGN